MQIPGSAIVSISRISVVKMPQQCLALSPIAEFFGALVVNN
jgi:hypothetical protein